MEDYGRKFLTIIFKKENVKPQLEGIEYSNLALF